MPLPNVQNLSSLEKKQTAGFITFNTGGKKTINEHKYDHARKPVRVGNAKQLEKRRTV